MLDPYLLNIQGSSYTEHLFLIIVRCKGSCALYVFNTTHLSWQPKYHLKITKNKMLQYKLKIMKLVLIYVSAFNMERNITIFSVAPFTSTDLGGWEIWYRKMHLVAAIHWAELENPNPLPRKILILSVCICVCQYYCWRNVFIVKRENSCWLKICWSEVIPACEHNNSYGSLSLFFCNCLPSNTTVYWMFSQYCFFICTFPMISSFHLCSFYHKKILNALRGVRWNSYSMCIQYSMLTDSFRDIV